MLWTSLNHAFLVRSWNFSATNAPKKYDEIHWQKSTAYTLPKTNQSHLKMMKMDGWKTIVSFWDTFWELHLFSCEHLRFRGGGTVTSWVVWHFLGGRFQPSQQPRPTPRESRNRGPRNGGAWRIHHNRWWASEATLETSLVLTWIRWVIGWLVGCWFLHR